MALKPMSPEEELYYEISRFEKKLKLLKEKIAARIPARTTAKPKGWFIDHEGKKIHYDRKRTS